MYAGLVRERGEIFVLADKRNDEKLIRHGHVDLVKKTELKDARACDPCTKSFMGDDSFNIHLHGRIHPGSPNYGGPEARTHRAQPERVQRDLLAGPVGPDGQVTVVW